MLYKILLPQYPMFIFLQRNFLLVHFFSIFYINYPVTIAIMAKYKTKYIINIYNINQSLMQMVNFTIWKIFCWFQWAWKAQYHKVPQRVLQQMFMFERECYHIHIIHAILYYHTYKILFLKNFTKFHRNSVCSTSAAEFGLILLQWLGYWYSEIEEGCQLQSCSLFHGCFLFI